MESLVALSTKYKELTKQILTSSQPSSSSKRQEANEILQTVNSDIEGLKTFLILLIMLMLWKKSLSK